MLTGGLGIEQRLGGNLPRFFPVIDRWKNGIATSIKSIDLTAKSYKEDIPRLGRVIERYIDRVAGFQGASFNGVVVKSSQIKGRALELAIQPGVAMPQQTHALQALTDYANKMGVHIKRSSDVLVFIHVNAKREFVAAEVEVAETAP